MKNFDELWAGVQQAIHQINNNTKNLTQFFINIDLTLQIDGGALNACPKY